MVTDEYGNKLEGFYLVGFFDKGRMAKFTVQKAKPFLTDENGRSSGCCFRGFKRNSFATDWEFILDYKVSEVNKDNKLRDWINDIWKDWCKKHRRKYSPILKKLTKGE